MANLALDLKKYIVKEHISENQEMLDQCRACIYECETWDIDDSQARDQENRLMENIQGLYMALEKLEAKNG